MTPQLFSLDGFHAGLLPDGFANVPLAVVNVDTGQSAAVIVNERPGWQCGDHRYGLFSDLVHQARKDGYTHFRVGADKAPVVSAAGAEDKPAVPHGWLLVTMDGVFPAVTPFYVKFDGNYTTDPVSAAVYASEEWAADYAARRKFVAHPVRIALQ